LASESEAEAALTEAGGTISKYSTYCTICKTNVKLSNTKFVKLATRMAVIEGNCTVCSTLLIKGKIMPTSGKNPLRKSKRKGNKKRLSVYKTSKQQPSSSKK
jgi:hypothetical protein